MSRAASAAPDRRGVREASCRSDVPEYSRTPRARRRGKIARLSHHCLMAEERERHGLLRFAVEEQQIEEHDGTWLDLCGQALDERGILRATPGDHDLGTVILSPARYRATDRLGCERRRRRHGVVVRAARLAHSRE